ncbi:MAG: hypothetical protein MZW92_60455 [Comamonadaceae bacterium]|nr:hypothetical protein [Comamonadaceae bacterium]
MAAPPASAGAQTLDLYLVRHGQTGWNAWRSACRARPTTRSTTPAGVRRPSCRSGWPA